MWPQSPSGLLADADGRRYLICSTYLLELFFSPRALVHIRMILQQKANQESMLKVSSHGIN